MPCNRRVLFVNICSKFCSIFATVKISNLATLSSTIFETLVSALNATEFSAKLPAYSHPYLLYSPAHHCLAY